MRDNPKYIVSFLMAFDNEKMTPAQAGVAALCEMRNHPIVTVYDSVADRYWDVSMRDHDLTVVEVKKSQFSITH